MSDQPTFAQLLAAAEALSPEQHPEQAVVANQHLLQLDPANAAAQVRLARAFLALRKLAEAEAACQEALRLHPGSIVALRRMQRIREEWALAQQAQAVTSFEAALRRGKQQKDEEYAGYYRQ